MQKIDTDKKRISVLLPAETVEVISALSKIYDCTVSDIVNRVLNSFARQNKAAVEIINKMHKAARADFEEIANIDTGENPKKKAAFDSGNSEQ